MKPHTIKKATPTEAKVKYDRALRSVAKATNHAQRQRAYKSLAMADRSLEKAA